MFMLGQRGWSEHAKACSGCFSSVTVHIKSTEDMGGRYFRDEDHTELWGMPARTLSAQKSVPLHLV